MINMIEDEIRFQSLDKDFDFNWFLKDKFNDKLVFDRSDKNNIWISLTEEPNYSHFTCFPRKLPTFTFNFIMKINNINLHFKVTEAEFLGQTMSREENAFHILDLFLQKNGYGSLETFWTCYIRESKKNK